METISGLLCFLKASLFLLQKFPFLVAIFFSLLVLLLQLNEIYPCIFSNKFKPVITSCSTAEVDCFIFQSELAGTRQF